MLKFLGVSLPALCALLLACSRNELSAAGTPPATQPIASATVVPATLTGGLDTDPRDRGRPDGLVAAGLGVPTDVFRDAFSHVRPAPAGAQPDPAQVQANKQALLSALGKYGITNDRLDEVSNYYRYPPGDPKLWKHEAAVVKASVVSGKVTGFTIEKAGAGYTTPPHIAVTGFPNLKADVVLHFGKDLATNGSIESVKLADTP